MAKPKRKNNKRNTLNNHSSKPLHSKKREVRPQATATGQTQQSKVWYLLYIAYKIGRLLEFLLNYWPSDF